MSEQVDRDNIKTGVLMYLISAFEKNKIDETHKSANHVSMKTNVDLNVQLVDRARKLTGLKTKKEVINHALSELVRKKDQKRILNLQGKISWTGDLNEMRKSRF